MKDGHRIPYRDDIATATKDPSPLGLPEILTKADAASSVSFGL